ncbi:MAG: nuclear transport factor 2 family protein [Pseudomonadota bacterium]
MDAAAFARQWERDWNSQDLDGIMSHFRDDIVFRSTGAVPVLGTPEVRGKPSLRAYWNAAFARQPDLHVEVVDVFAGENMVVITYRDQRDVLSAKTMCFDADDKVYMASACFKHI